MPDSFIKYAQKYEMFPETGMVLACVSGGADSMCLLELLLEIFPAGGGVMINAVHFNHKLRGAESDGDEEFVREYCKKRDVLLFAGSGDTTAYAKENKLGIEDAARRLRYGFFEETARVAGAVRIATAHTADDNAETVIMNLTRGAGLSGISGIAPVRGKIIRPMLRMSREEVLEFLSMHEIPFREDSTNALDIYTRNRIRHRIIPELKAVNPRFLDSVFALSSLLRTDEEYLQAETDKFTNEHCEKGTADAAALCNLPEAIAGRVVRRLYGGSLSHGHVGAVLSLCKGDRPSGSVSLPGMTVFRQYDKLVFCTRDLPSGFEPFFPIEGQTVTIPENGLKITCKMVECDDKINKSFTRFLFKSVDICGRITVRPRLEGDFLRLFGGNGKKTLKKLFIERHIPVRKRALVPVIADECGVLAVYGIGTGDRAVPKHGDIALEISFEEGSDYDGGF